jgi:hypothetical protein
MRKFPRVCQQRCDLKSMQTIPRLDAALIASVVKHGVDCGAYTRSGQGYVVRTELSKHLCDELGRPVACAGRQVAIKVIETGDGSVALREYSSMVKVRCVYCTVLQMFRLTGGVT